jgi:peptidyl-prolyl cis-trans isomerase D
MLSVIRSFAKTWVAKVLLALIMFSFLFIGARNGLPSAISNDVVEAGSRHVTPGEFKHMFDNYKQQVEQENGQPLSMRDAVVEGLDKRVLQEVASNESTLEYLRRSGIRPADQLIADALHDQQAFFDPVTGRFDEKAYHDKLAGAQLTPARYESLLRDQIAQNHLASGLGAGLRAPLIYGALIAGFELESRSLSYFVIDPRNLPPLVPPTDAQLQAFMHENAPRLMEPELRTLTLVRFSAKALAPSMPVDDAALRKLYNFRKDAASTPEKRTLVEIPLKDAAAAAAVVKRLKSGEAPAAVAKSVGVQPIVYTDAAKGAIADPKVADAAFSLKAGEIGGPVPSGLAGFAVIALQQITPAKTADFDAMRPALEAQVRNDAAGQKVYDQVQKFEDAHGGGASLADAAKAAGVSPITVGPVAANGATALGQPAPGLSPKLLKDAFNLAQNGETEVEDDGAGEYFIVHVDKVTPPALPSLQDTNVKQAIARVYTIQQLTTQLQTRAAELADRLRKGESLDAVAASVSATVAHAPAVTRAAMAKNQSLDPEFLGKLFGSKAGEVITGRTGQVAVMVAHVDAIHPAAAALAAPMAVQESRQVTGQLFESLGQSVRAAALASVKPRIYQDHALAALGLSPDDLPKTAAPPAKRPGLAQ